MGWFASNGSSNGFQTAEQNPRVRSIAMISIRITIVVVVVVGQTVGSISSKTLAYDCLYTLELCTASMIATS